MGSTWNHLSEIRIQMAGQKKAYVWVFDWVARVGALAHVVHAPQNAALVWRHALDAAALSALQPAAALAIAVRRKQVAEIDGIERPPAPRFEASSDPLTKRLDTSQDW